METCTHTNENSDWVRIPSWFGEVHRHGCTDCGRVRLTYADTVGGQEFANLTATGQLADPIGA